MRIITLIITFFIHNILFSQKLSSSYYSTPINVNPANTGNFVGDYRIGISARTMKSPFSTNFTSDFFIDCKVLNSLTLGHSTAAIGVGARKEEDPFNGIRSTYLPISLAYAKHLDEDGISQISVGFQANISRLNIEPPSYIFEDQLLRWAQMGYIGDYFSTNRVNINYVDLNAGINYKTLINQRHLLSTGITIFHTNKPQKAFDGGTFSLSPEFNFQASLDIEIPEKNTILTYFMLNRNNELINNILVAGIYQHNLGSGVYKLNTGIIFQNDRIYGTSLSPCLGLKFQKFNLNISYDVIISEDASIQRNAFEINLLFKTKKLKK